MIALSVKKDRLLNGFTEADIGAAAAKCHYSPQTNVLADKMLHDARMATMRKLRRGI